MSESHLTLETLLAILILLFYTVSTPLFEKYHFHYMHESGLCMLIGVAITLIVMVISPESNFAQTLKFDSEIFFTFILPPIIFAAGYNLRRRSFFKYFLYISLFGVLGTIMTFLTVAPLTYIANKYELFSVTFGTDIILMEDDYEKSHKKNEPSHRILSNVGEPVKFENLEEENLKNYELDNNDEDDKKAEDIEKDDKNVEDKEKETENEDKHEEKKEIKEENAHILHFSLKEILLFASVISATDTVAALTFIKEEAEPKLFAILFGEGVINDAVCIVLYGIIREFTSSNEEFTSKTPIRMVGSFLSMFFFSFVIGMLVGVISSLFLKKLKNFKLNRVQECSIIIFFAFISYTLTEELGLSPIIALLFTGIFMSHYTFYNLSFQAREESSVVSRIMANIAEAFVFTYLGLTVIYYTSIAFSFSFIFLELIFVILGRVIAIYGLTFLMGLLKVKNFNLKQSHKGIMSCAGSIRGAIAFGLAISIDTKDKVNKEVLISSTLMLVFFTTIVFGALMPAFINFFKSFDEKTNAVATHQYVELDNLNHSIAFDYLHPNFSTDLVGVSKEKDEEKLKQRLSYWLGTYWVDFDNVYMKPKLIYGWPTVKDEHDDISKIVKNVIKDYTQEKKLKDANDNSENIKRQLTEDYRFEEMRHVEKIDNSKKKTHHKHFENFNTNDG